MQAAQSPVSAFKSVIGLEGNGCKFKMPISFASKRSFSISSLSFNKRSARFKPIAAASPLDGLQALKTTTDRFVKHWSSAFSFNNCEEGSQCSSLLERSGDVPTSPKQMLGLKWWEYAGCNDWKGLLDPLDANLRREIVKYGELVQASYSACDFDPQSKTYGQCKYPKDSLVTQVGLQGSGYRVTHHIHATSAIKVPQWLTAMLSSFSQSDAKWMSRRTNWIGFVAVCEDDKEVARLGRRDIVVSLRGTVTPLEWLENLRDILTPVTSVTGQANLDSEQKVQSGFWNLYTCKDADGRSASIDVLDEIKRLLELYAGEEISITITGHSLGAALALLSAYQVGAAGFRSKAGRSVPVTVLTFGGPRVGNGAFGRRIEEMRIKVLRIVNTQDVITKVPGVVLQEWAQRSWIFGYLESRWWAYRHVGTELRVNNKNSPYLKPDADMACCHDLEAYLHLIDGFFSSSVPFRKSAKRDILRLLVNQKSNVLLKAATGKKSRANRREISL